MRKAAIIGLRSFIVKLYKKNILRGKLFWIGLLILIGLSFIYKILSPDQQFSIKHFLLVILVIGIVILITETLISYMKKKAQTNKLMKRMYILIATISATTELFLATFFDYFEDLPLFNSISVPLMIIIFLLWMLLSVGIEIGILTISLPYSSKFILVSSIIVANIVSVFIHIIITIFGYSYIEIFNHYLISFLGLSERSVFPVFFLQLLFLVTIVHTLIETPIIWLSVRKNSNPKFKAIAFYIALAKIIAYEALIITLSLLEFI